MAKKLRWASGLMHQMLSKGPPGASSAAAERAAIHPPAAKNATSASTPGSLRRNRYMPSPRHRLG